MLDTGCTPEEFMFYTVVGIVGLSYVSIKAVDLLERYQMRKYNRRNVENAPEKPAIENTYIP